LSVGIESGTDLVNDVVAALEEAHKAIHRPKAVLAG
jgi:hypothetical protein